MSNFDETILKRVKALEREVERLKVKESPIMSNYLLTTGKAADSDKLDGVDSTGFATSGHDHSGVYLPVSGKAADSDKLDGIDSTGFVNTTSTQTVAGVKTFSSIPVLPSSNPTTSNQAVRKGYADATYLGITAKAADADKLDGIDSTGFATAGHDHNAAYLGITAKAADSDKLDGIDSSSFGRPVFLTTPLTSTDWDGDSISTQATGIQIDLSTTHSVPAGVKAVMVRCYIRDSASATTNNLYFALSSGSTGYPQYAIRCSGLPNDYLMDTFGIVPCDASGDIYYRSAASGTGTMDVWIVITGYWL